MKKTLRKEALQKRNAIPLLERKRKDALIMRTLFSMSEFEKSHTIFFYVSFRTEVDTISMIKESLARSRRVVVPKVDKEKQRLVLYEIKDTGELSPGYLGIPEPFLEHDRITDINDVDLVIVPGAGFDYSGNRLGYGAGYYDALLSTMQKKVPFIALAYEEQLIDSIPSELHDINVDMIVTDKQVIKI